MNLKRALTVGPPCRRRRVCVAVGTLTAIFHSSVVLADLEHPNRKWHQAAESMRQLALSWGDQPYGAVLVTTSGVVGEGPSRVVKNSDQDAHAEREAIRDAQLRLGRADLVGSVLYSTSRPCRLCEQAAARANVSRMYFGDGLVDAGRPRQ
jgi:tRNA(Arg) A34 adenosine deaminase TadA